VAYQAAQNVSQLRQCGRRGTFTMKQGSGFSKEAITAALKENRLELASAEEVTRQRAQREISYDFAKPST